MSNEASGVSYPKAPKTTGTITCRIVRDKVVKLHKGSASIGEVVNEIIHDCNVDKSVILSIHIDLVNEGDKT